MAFLQASLSDVCTSGSEMRPTSTSLRGQRDYSDGLPNLRLS